MPLPQQIVDAVYLAITNSPTNDKALNEAISALYTEKCIDLFEATLQDPENDALSNEDLIALVDPIFLQVAEDFNEILAPYNTTIREWDCKSLARRVESISKGEVNE